MSRLTTLQKTFLPNICLSAMGHVTEEQKRRTLEKSLTIHWIIMHVKVHIGNSRFPDLSCWTARLAAPLPRSTLLAIRIAGRAGGSPTHKSSTDKRGRRCLKSTRTWLL